ncbi:MAG: tetratricopeptide repeat protein [Planctomycetaceae bacterium]|jgi:tetratricopeptide (TPR) repeat protein|nr:tetratricopeptide repeat protein [Planctomycetaceae bacterium]MBT6155155.1 tetratricopeptide repeat protein [Planctomycetaceae bacterium]MBT6483329.1 tetratricopeptide repeat protein [Planctomycetaceae bacterium]MBT6493876.1 tetratricopeptide repeat protein [Planctomycetaceae bacterium]
MLDFRSKGASAPGGSHNRGLQIPQSGEPAIVRGAGSKTRVTARLVTLLALILTSAATASAAEIAECHKLLITGHYDECIDYANKAIDSRAYGEHWYVLKSEAELTVGRYRDAEATVDAGLKRYSWSICLRLVGHDATRQNGHAERGDKWLKEIDQLANRTPWRYTDADDLVALGRAALLMGADARDVLVGLYDRAKKNDPNHRAAYLASGELAFDKNDPELAAEIFQVALKRFPEDPDVQFGLAKAFVGADSKLAAAALAKTLELNPRHVPALLFQAERLIDSEQYEAAEEKLTQILKVNPRQTDMWANRAIIAHLHNDPRGEEAFRCMAQGHWGKNPRVEYLIGRKLSQKYRFAEGAAYQRRALTFAPNYLPARIQLSQDLLRLGEEDEGWKIAESVHHDDGYEVATFNLIELRDRIEKFRTLENEHFILRMETHEAEVYGREVLKLLGDAKATLCKKYDLQLTDKITVEIFPDENDFAVRTFGMPAVSGYLGVCFGKVITANSPASQTEHPSNWQAVLWHEFCHVVTLHATHNKMPRWLSEGISVHEELQRDPTWGQRMTPRYRQMILNGELTPVGKLSGAFLSPASSLRLQFAYYESALVVEFLVKQYGQDALKHVLGDLAIGLPINVALQRRTDPLPKLEQEFEQFARQRAAELGPQADWSEPDLAALVDNGVNNGGDVVGQLIKTQPNNIMLLTHSAQQHIENGEWEQAKQPARKLMELCPSYIGGDCGYRTLARAHRELGETADEIDVLEKLAALDSGALDVYLRLLELGTIAGDWTLVRNTAHRALAVNPLIPQPHRALAQVGERLDHPEEAIAACRTLLSMQPDDPAAVSYRLALLLHRRGDPEAKLFVLSALEEAPRFRAAHRLLLEIVRQQE